MRKAPNTSLVPGDAGGDRIQVRGLTKGSEVRQRLVRNIDFRDEFKREQRTLGIEAIEAFRV